MRLLVLPFLLALLVIFASDSEDASAHYFPIHGTLWGTGGAFLDQSSLMECNNYPNNNSLTWTANLWNNVFIQYNGWVPKYYYSSSSCMTLPPDYSPVLWRDFYSPCDPQGCQYGYTEPYGVRLTGGWGKCGPGLSYCPVANAALVYMNNQLLDPGDAFTHVTAVHEAGHPIGIGDYYAACSGGTVGIMNINCILAGHSSPGVHDGVDVQQIY